MLENGIYMQYGFEMSTCVVRIWIRINKSYFYAIMTDRSFFSFGCFCPLSNLFFPRKNLLLWMLVSLVWSEEAGERFMTWFIGSTNDPFITTTPGPSFYTTPFYTATPSMLLYHTHMQKKHSMHICLGKVHKNGTFSSWNLLLIECGDN